MRSTLTAVPEVRLLDVQSDPSHNRSTRPQATATSPV
ncbi:MAG: hypothetical protein L0221_18540 [Chloroflexi bacterium]|nr:hypothetical protein [Chloroflexota bacterium]